MCIFVASPYSLPRDLLNVMEEVQEVFAKIMDFFLILSLTNYLSLYCCAII